ncbi:MULTISPECIES: SHOCT domain-containing protein [unclassified Streptomyces]|uniref:SHOCT domain-containing protein n=1 Tax=unclassified Streptomyces TaxID=2593676 RepID=UPI003D94A899
MCDAYFATGALAALSVLLLLAVLAAGLSLRTVRASLPRTSSAPPRPLEPQHHAVEILKDSYARGEIDHDEFSRRLDALLTP